MINNGYLLRVANGWTGLDFTSPFAGHNLLYEQYDCDRDAEPKRDPRCVCILSLTSIKSEA